MMREVLERRMDGLDGRMGRLESAVVTHSGEIRNLATRVGAVESKLDAKADASRVDAFEARLLARDR